MMLRLAFAAAAPAAPPLALHSLNGEGISFFNAMRTPAALVAAAAIKDAFALQSAPADIKSNGGWAILRNAYLLLQLLAFCTEVECVFVSTHAILRLQMAKDISELGMSTSLISLMKNAFEFEYVAVRSSFMTGLLAFLTAQSLRARFALRGAKEGACLRRR